MYTNTWLDQQTRVREMESASESPAYSVYFLFFSSYCICSIQFWQFRPTGDYDYSSNTNNCNKQLKQLNQRNLGYAREYSERERKPKQLPANCKLLVVWKGDTLHKKKQIQEIKN